MIDDKIAYMANQIARAFATKGPEAQAEAVADHIGKFWEPRMRAKLLDLVAEGGAGLDPAVLRAAETIRVPRPSPV